MIRRGRARRSAAERFERAALARRQRAQAHLARVRGGGRGPRIGDTRLRAAVVLGTSLVSGALLGSPLLAAALPRLAGDRVRVEAIHVRGASQLGAEEVAAATGLAPAAALGEVDPAAVAQQLVAHPWIADARVVQLPNGSLLVDVVERIGVALLEGEDGAVWVDATGTPFAPLEGEAPAGLPRIATAEPMAPGSADARLATAVDLAYGLPALGLEVAAEVAVAAEGDAEGFVLRARELSARIVLGRDDPLAKLDALARLVDGDVPGLATAVRIDLRFADKAFFEPAPEGAAKAAAPRGHAAPSKTEPTG